jgi:tRNA dimethylallyltransferase
MPAAAPPVPVPPILVIAGPTGSGKSALALALAEARNGVVINGDALQVYRELRILTNRPALEEEARVAHRLFGILSASEPCSAGRWLALAEAEIAAAQTAGCLPIVAGGTGLYLKALIEGLADVPAVDPAIRAEATALYERLGGAAFRDRLAALDAAAAARLPATDRQRLIRAYEVASATGRPLAAWQASPSPQPSLDARCLVLLPPRDALYRRLDARFDAMLAAGALGEAQALLDLPDHLPAMKALGLKHLRAYLRGQLSLEDARRLAQRDTRRYAKRQMTWARHQMAGATVVEKQYSETFPAEIFSIVDGLLLTPGT